MTHTISPGGPVFFYDQGEYEMSNSTAARVLAETNGTTAVMALARQYTGLAILWEHRYYGLSLPFPMVLSTATNIGCFPAYEPQGAPKSWQYLTIDQALGDVVYFANNLKTGQYQNAHMEQLSPKKTPWIWVGGSYPGDRGAWLRQRNPEVIYATWSSSPPTQAMFDGNTYFNDVLRSLPSNCSTDVRAMVPHIDTVISGKQGEEELLKLLRLNYVVGLATNLTNYYGAYNISEAQEVFTLFTPATRFCQASYSVYQSYGFSYTSRVFCEALQSYAPGAAGRIQNDSYLNIVTNPGTSQPSPSGFLAQHNGNLSLGMEAMRYAIKVYEAYYLDLVFAVAANSSDSPPNSLQTWHPGSTR